MNRKIKLVIELNFDIDVYDVFSEDGIDRKTLGTYLLEDEFSLYSNTFEDFIGDVKVINIVGTTKTEPDFNEEREKLIKWYAKELTVSVLEHKRTIEKKE